MIVVNFLTKFLSLSNKKVTLEQLDSSLGPHMPPTNPDINNDSLTREMFVSACANNNQFNK